MKDHMDTIWPLEMPRRAFMVVIARGLLAAPLAAETFSGSCQAICF
jgi:hypothetical protein